MGKVGRALFGGPAKSSAKSGNHAWEGLNQSLMPSVGFVGQSGNGIANLLGLNGGEAQTGGLENFANSGGYKFLMDKMTDQVNSSASARGLLKSGSTLKALQDRGNALGSTYLNQYMEHMLGLGGLGLGAGNVLADAGKWSQEKSEGKKKGIVPSLVKAFAMKGAS